MEDQGSAVSNVLRSKLRAGMISRREFIAAAAMLGVGTALSACAPDGTAAPAESEALAPRHGGKLVYGIDNQLQPFHYRTAWVAEAQWDIYERLLDRDPQGKLVPYLAESFKVSDDGLAVTFTLKPGKKFHNGDPVDAKAIKALFDRWTDPKTDYTETFYTAVRKVETPDERTVILRLEYPDTSTYLGTAFLYSPVVNVKSVEANPQGYGKELVVGSGPFRFEKWEGDSVTVTRNVDYSGPPDYVPNKRAPYLDQIAYTFIPDQATRAVNLESGTFDMVQNPAPQDVRRLEGDSRFQVMKRPAPALLYMGFNFKKQELLGDKRVREAIYRAVDRELIIQKVFFGQGNAAYSPVVPHDTAYWKGAETLYPYNTGQAKALLDQAGWREVGGGGREKDGKQFVLDLIILSTTEQKTLAQVIQDQLAKVGVRINILVLDKGAHQERQLAGAYDLNFFRYLYDSSIDVLKVLYDSRRIPPKGPNWAFYSNPKADALFDSFRRTTDLDKRNQAIIEVQKVLLDDIVQVPITNPLDVWVLQKWVKGFQPHNYSVYPLHNSMWVTEASPRAK